MMRLELRAVPDRASLRRLFIDTLAGGEADLELAPTQRILDWLIAQQAAVAIIQRSVQDPDFLAEHAAYYSRWIYSIAPYCTRLHFFSSCVSTSDVIDAIDELHASHADSYLGFVTLRPVTQVPIGATFLKADAGDATYVHAADDFPVNIAGRRFSVRATPFMQQDNAVGACAQTSIWMALRTLRLKEGRSAFNPAEITAAATQFVVSGRTLPNRDGLRLEQIAQAVRAAGYAPHVLTLRPPERAMKGHAWLSGEHEQICAALYPYVESGIPILLLLQAAWGGHAVVIVGHGWTAASGPNPLAQSERQSMPVCDASNWAHPFIINNDNSGPYLRLPRGPARGAPANYAYSMANATYAIPLMPPGVWVDGTEARAACIDLVQRMGLPFSAAATGQSVSRVRLVARWRFREAAAAAPALSRALRRYYRQKWLPRFMWSMQFNALDGYERAGEARVRTLGEVLLDPTANPMEGHFLAIRFAGETLTVGRPDMDLVIDREPVSGRVTAQWLQRD